jgi:hypothetical protein
MDHVWGRLLDENNVPMVIKHRVVRSATPPTG